MADQEGLEELRGLLERRTRSVPPPRRPRSHIDDTTAIPDHTPARPEPQAQVVEAGAELQGSAGPEPASERSGMAPPPASESPAGSGPSVPSEIPRERAAEPLPVPPLPRPAVAPVGAEPTANLTLRIRRSLDLRLVELLHSLRRDGVRSSKKELIEMCISELPFEPSEQLRARLRAYRETVPKEPL